MAFFLFSYTHAGLGEMEGWLFCVFSAVTSKQRQVGGSENAKTEHFYTKGAIVRVGKAIFLSVRV